MKRQKCKGNVLISFLGGLVILLIVSVIAMAGITAVVYYGMKVDAEVKAESAKNSLVVPAPVYPDGIPSIHLE